MSPKTGNSSQLPICLTNREPTHNATVVPAQTIKPLFFAFAFKHDKIHYHV